MKNLASILQVKLQDNFLARFDQNLARKLSCNFFLQETAKTSLQKPFIMNGQFPWNIIELSICILLSGDIRPKLRR